MLTFVSMTGWGAPLIDEHDNPCDQDCCPETIAFLPRAQPNSGPDGLTTMHPLRAFLLSFAMGSFLLFGGYGLKSAMTPPKTDHTITV
jgi:hypothetical protein